LAQKTQPASMLELLIVPGAELPRPHDNFINPLFFTLNFFGKK
jgi:hypothetical protein